MANYIETFKSSLDWANVFVRTGNFPLDRSSIFGSYEDAVKYAQGDNNNPDSRGLQGTSYVGQIIAVYEEGKVNVYQITEGKTLSCLVQEDEFHSQKDELIKRLQGVSENTDAKLDPYKQLGVFTKLSDLVSELDNYKDKAGYYRAKVDNLFYNIVCCESNSQTNQTIVGPLSIGEDGLEVNVSVYSLATRVWDNNAQQWGEWQLINANIIADIKAHIQDIDASITTLNDNVSVLTERDIEIENEFVNRLQGTSKNTDARLDSFQRFSFSNLKETVKYFNSYVVENGNIESYTEHAGYYRIFASNTSYDLYVWGNTLASGFTTVQKIQGCLNVVDGELVEDYDMYAVATRVWDDIEKQWDEWKVAYDSNTNSVISENEKVFARALNDLNNRINAHEEEFINRLQGTSENTDAKLDPYKFLGNFSKVEELLETLDLYHITSILDENIKNGNFRFMFKGCVCELKVTGNWASATGTQVLSGPFGIEDRQLTFVENSYAILIRVWDDVEKQWSEWKIACDNNTYGNLLAQDGSSYDSVSGKLILKRNDENATIEIPLNSNYGTVISGDTSWSNNRLQFAHCDILFATREEAQAYVNGNLIKRDRPSLYAEPMILKYGDINNPNIILAIGAIGEGTQDDKNKVFFIDYAKLDEENNFSFVDTNSIKFTLTESDKEINVQPQVKLEDNKVVSGQVYDNILLDEENGIFAHVNVKMVEDKLAININGDIQEYELPDTVISGKYIKNNTQLQLETRKNKVYDIDLSEVVTLSNNTNNIIQRDEDNDLFATVDINYDSLTNELTVDNGINNGKKIVLSSNTQNTINQTVEKELKSLKCLGVNTSTIETNVIKEDNGTSISSNIRIKNDGENIIQYDINGIYANADLSYIKASNKLIFKAGSKTQEFNLSSHSLVQAGAYDANKKAIVLTIAKDTEEGVKLETIDIPIGDIVYTLQVPQNQQETPVKLLINRDNEHLVDVISASFEISSAPDNLASIEGGTGNLYVKGNAKKMFVEWDDELEDITIQNAFDKTRKMLSGLTAADVQHNEAIEKLQNNLSITEDEVNKELTNLTQKITTLESVVKNLITRLEQLTDFGDTNYNIE